MGFRPRASETRVYPLHHSPKKCGSRRPDSHRQCADARRILSPLCLLISPRRDPNWCGWRELHPQWACARRLLEPPRLLVTPHPQKNNMEHPQGCAPCWLPYQGSPSLSTGWMRELGRSGRIRTFVAREGVAFTARCNCSYATLRKNGGLGQELHLRPSPYEGAALTAAPPSQSGGSPRYCPEFCRLRGGGFTD